MKFAVIGGDARAGWLAALLSGDGHTVRCYALEKAALPQRVLQCSSLEACVYGADWVIVGIPAEKSGALNTPLSVQKLETEELITALWPGQTLCGGKFGQAVSLSAVRAGLSVCDLMARRDFTVGNAALTAEGAIGLLIRESPRSLWKGRALVTGWGRVASQLGPRLRALGCETLVAARKAGDRAEAEACGLTACSFDALPALAGELDFLINTVPAPVISREVLTRLMKEEALLLPEPVDRDGNALVPYFVELSAMNSSSVDLTVRAYCKAADYWTAYFKMQDKFYRTINSDPKLNIPFQTQTLHIVKD